MLYHAGQFHHPAQRLLAPAAARLRPAQRGDQRLGLDPELHGVLPGDLDLLGQRGVGQVPRLV